MFLSSIGNQIRKMLCVFTSSLLVLNRPLAVPVVTVLHVVVVAAAVVVVVVVDFPATATYEGSGAAFVLLA